MSYARGRCWDIFLWVFHFYEVFEKESGESIDGYKEVAMKYLAHLGSSLIEFKRRALNSEMDAEEEGITIRELTSQIKLCFKSYSDIPHMEKIDPQDEASLDFPDRERYGFRAKETPGPFTRKNVS